MESQALASPWQLDAEAVSWKRFVDEHESRLESALADMTGHTGVYAFRQTRYYSDF